MRIQLTRLFENLRACLLDTKYNGILHVIIALVLCALIIGPLTWTQLSGSGHGLSSTLSIILAVFILGLATFSTRLHFDKFKALLPLSLLALITLISDRSLRPYGIFAGAGLDLSSILLILLAMAPIFALIFNKAPRLATFAICVLLGSGFLLTCSKELLFSDDHPTFLFRLMTLKESFPHVPSLYPLWNAGIEFRDFFASGALGIFLLFYPLIMFFELTNIYNLIVALLLFGVAPAASFFASRIFKLDYKSSCLAALLAISPCGLWYRWALSYGTLGFILSVALLPLLVALAWKLSNGDPIRCPKTIALGTIGVSLFLLWPIGTLAALPLIGLCLFYVRPLWRSASTHWLVLALTLLNLPWMILFADVSNVAGFLQREKSHQIQARPVSLAEAPVTIKKEQINTRTISPASLIKEIRAETQSFNLIAIFLTLIGFGFLPRKVALFLGVEILGLILIGSFGPLFKPQLELDRFLIFAVVLSSIPAAASLRNMQQLGQVRSIRGVICTSISYLLLAAGLLSTYLIITNRSHFNFQIAKSNVSQLSDLIRLRGGDGRVLFAGFTLHELSGGHVAPLSHFTNMPLMARSYKHDHWNYVDIIPTEFRDKGGARLEEFFDLYNVSSIVVHDKFWRNFFARKPDLYQAQEKIDGFMIYQRTSAPTGYFLEGSGEIIEQSSRGLKLRLLEPNATIKFHFMPGLVNITKPTSDLCQMSAQEVFPGTDFIKMTNCPVGTEIQIEMQTPWTRLANSLLD